MFTRRNFLRSVGTATAMAGLASFSEGGRGQCFLDEAAKRGFQAHALSKDTPRLLAATAELRKLLRKLAVDVLV